MPLDRRWSRRIREQQHRVVALIDPPCADKHHCQKNSDHSAPSNISARMYSERLLCCSRSMASNLVILPQNLNQREKPQYLLCHCCSINTNHLLCIC